MNCCGNTSQQKNMKSSRDHNLAQTTGKGGGLSWKWPSLCALGLVAVVIAVFFLKISLTNILFYSVLLTCPLMHFFMMKGHDHNSDNPEQKKEKKNS